MTKDTPSSAYQEVVDAIVKAVPEIMALERGCFVYDKMDKVERMENSEFFPHLYDPSLSTKGSKEN